MKTYTKIGYVQYEAGDRINDFIEVSEAVEGGMGTVYFCFCHKRQKQVILKTIKKDFWESHYLRKSWDQYREQLINDSLPPAKLFTVADYILFVFFREARITCQMDGHLNVVSGYNFWWTDEGQPFLECQFVEGRTDLNHLFTDLRKKKKDLPIGLLQIAHIAVSFCNGLIHINQKGVQSYNQSKAASGSQTKATAFVHRDIKPNNILITKKNLIRIIDLGLAKFIIQDEDSLSQYLTTPVKAGAPAFMSPEQLRHYDHVFPASDVYSFGATLYWLLGGSKDELEQRTTEEPLPGLKDVPEEFMAIIHKCLAWKISKRYANFMELKEDLIRFLENVKSGHTEIPGNLRCASCGWVTGQTVNEGRRPAQQGREMAPPGENLHSFVRIPGGYFYSGCEPKQEKQLLKRFGSVFPGGFKAPHRRIYVDDFEIGAFPVTNQQYFSFVQATQHPFPPHWAKGGRNPFPPDEKRYPVVNVSFSDAVAYCEWAKVRLPTGEEWEKAARGETQFLYPWGNEYLPTLCNSAESNNGNLVAVDAYEKGKSPYGCFQMAGNVLEWVNEPHPDHSSFHFLRGGSCQESCELFGLTFLKNLAAGPNEIEEVFGFRVARDVTDQQEEQEEADPHVFGDDTILLPPTNRNERCPLCGGGLVVFNPEDIKIPDRNIFSWNGFFDIP